MRSWLKLTANSGVLETFRPSEATRGQEPEAYARDLLARLRLDEGGLRSDDPLAVDFVAFRRWVEAERRSKRLEAQAVKPRRYRLSEPWPEPPVANDAQAAKKAAAWKASSPSLLGRWLERLRKAVADLIQGPPADVTHPMWDRWLDG